MSTPCPCNPTRTYDACCGQYISHAALAPTPEALMRSRYSAYTLGEIDYVAATQAGPAAEGFNPAETQRWAASLTWDGVEIIEALPSEGSIAFVTFEAHYREGKKSYLLSEKSEFHHINGEWKYWAALPPARYTPVNLGRNALCECGSGKKYKRCCGQ